MALEAELSTFDLRYEGYRTRNAAQEARLLLSIQERGVDEPLQGVEAEGKRILLNGFKRYRSARVLGVGHVPWVSLGEDEAAGIIAMIRAANDKSLTILEQARFIDDLMRVHGMNLAEIAETVSRSKSWVCMRVGLMREMSAVVRDEVFAGAFPVYAYMYTLRPFMRMNGVARADVDAFVSAVSGRKLSVREIGQLADGYFKGPDWFRKEVDSGNLTLAVEQIRQVPESADGCNPSEGVLLRDIGILSKYTQRVIAKSQALRPLTRAFRAQANLLLARVLGRMNALGQALRDLHDRTG